MSTQSEEITIVDRVAPNVVTLKVDTNTSNWTTNLETTIKAEDTFSGMNTYSYSLVTNNTNGEVNVLVRDAIENIATFTYSIDNIDKTLPSFEDLSVTQNREEKKANITFSFSDDRELYGYVLKLN